MNNTCNEGSISYHSVPFYRPTVSVVREQLKKLYLREAFRPSLLGMFINPFYIARVGLFKAISAIADKVSGRVLDVGCGHKPYRDLFQCSEYIGLDIKRSDNKHADMYYDGNIIPYTDSSFDTVVTNQVLEHVFEPGQFLTEIHRILKPGGGVLVTVPFLWDEHEQPFDYARYSSFGLKHLLSKHGFEVVYAQKTVQDLRVLLQLLNCYIHKQFADSNPYLKAAVWILISGPINITGALLELALPENCDLFLDNVVFARKL